MALPELIEIVPLDKPVRAEITVPGSKSITNRALVLAALADGEVTLEGALWSEDTQIMVECLQDLGFMVNVAPDPNEFCNRTITVYGKGGTIPNGGTEENPLELYVGNAGTAARFLSAMVCLGNGVYRLHGVPRMHERPQGALFKALRELGYRVESEKGNDKLPVRISSSSRRESAQNSTATVSIEESSQFASALLLCAKDGRWEIEIMGGDKEEISYIEMTRKLINVFPYRGGMFLVEPDASSGSYFWGCNSNYESHRLRTPKLTDDQKLDWEKGRWRFENWAKNFNIGEITVANWPETRWQIDRDFPLVFPFDNVISRQKKLGDSIMTAIVLAPLAPETMVFTHLGRLRLQECERVIALRTELTKCGAKVIEEGDTLTVYPSHLHGAEIETYNDHRMAMCFAILGLKVPGIKIRNPTCVKKTFPNFFQKLATVPPHGLGATILDAKTGRKLEMAELFAE
ncbi:MAG TPA: 3-phosphoshikimate 1-carboxyvinyltransferase [Verrucomicrobiae bacterium]|nr:3-phosphoshikimate 1-carboxyvinyltransferase [Verrucomicrobiae bacterium]